MNSRGAEQEVRTISVRPLILSWGHAEPRIAPSAFVAPSAAVIGEVTLADRSSVYFGAVLRGDRASITVGVGTNLQDNVTVHGEVGFNVSIGTGVSVGHNAVIHGCVVEDNCLVGMGACLLNGSVIGAGSLIAGGTVVLEGTTVPPGSLVAGVPGKVRRQLTAEERTRLVENASIYHGLTQVYRTHLDAGTS